MRFSFERHRSDLALALVFVVVGGVLLLFTYLQVDDFLDHVDDSSRASLEDLFSSLGWVLGFIFLLSFFIIRHLIKVNEARMQRLAHYDPLTGLPNRALFSERLEQCILSASRDKSSLAVMFIDLDRFKHVNDTMGHSAGDELLKIVANRLLGCVRSIDTVARFGGDEFVVLLKKPDLSSVERIANFILMDIAAPCNIDGKVVQIRASIGIAMREGNLSAEEMVRRADIAMYRAKNAGKDTFRFYREHITEGKSFLMLGGEISSGLKSGEFHIEYQPQVDTSGAVCGVEALARWEHPLLGNIPPAEFIAVAEDDGLISELGCFVLDASIRDAAQWPLNSNGEPVRLSVNVSPKQLAKGDFADIVQSALKQNEFPASRLCIEITENVLVDQKVSVETITALRKMGVGVEIDDFGVGYSSLSYLKKIPVSGIKLDRSFILDIGMPHERLVALIVDIARYLNLTVVAEGIETQAQAEYLSSIGCDLLQGYLFSKPMDKERIARFIQFRGKPRHWHCCSSFLESYLG